MSRSVQFIPVRVTRDFYVANQAAASPNQFWVFSPSSCGAFQGPYGLTYARPDDMTYDPPRHQLVRGPSRYDLNCVDLAVLNIPDYRHVRIGYWHAKSTFLTEVYNPHTGRAKEIFSNALDDAIVDSCNSVDCFACFIASYTADTAFLRRSCWGKRYWPQRLPGRCDDVAPVDMLTVNLSVLRQYLQQFGIDVPADDQELRRVVRTVLARQSIATLLGVGIQQLLETNPK